MRVAQILTLVLVALATAACAHQQANYYALDPVTHQPVAQRYAPASYTQPQYAQAAQRQPATATRGRGLFSSPQIAERSYAQANFGQPAYRAQAAQPQSSPSGRGLFSSPQIAELSYGYGQTNQSQPTYRAQAAQPQSPPSGRGLFSTLAENRTAPTYPQPAYAQRTYAPQPAARPAYAPNVAQSSYAQTQERRYAAHPAVPYQPPSYGSGATYAAVAQSNPFQQARWY